MTEQLSRERLEEKLREHIKHGGDSEEETMIRMLLAGMDSKPLAVPDVATPETVQALSGVQACFAGGWAYLDESQREIASDVWNACRAAMLKAGPVTAATVPDDTKRLDWLDAQNKRLNEYYGTSYGWKFDANFQRNAMMLNDSNYPVMTVRQAIDEAMLAAAPAAPEQEV